MGDVTHLVGDSTDIAELKRRAEGSPLLDKAMVHPTPKPKPQRIVRGFHSLADVERVYAPALRERGMRVDLYDTEDGGSRLCIHVLGRHGKPLKAPRVVLAHMPFKDMEISAEVTLSLTDDGEVSTVYRRQEIIPKSKIPWRLNVNGTSRAWAHLDSAIPAFESALAEI